MPSCRTTTFKPVIDIFATPTGGVTSVALASDIQQVIHDTAKRSCPKGREASRYAVR